MNREFMKFIADVTDAGYAVSSAGVLHADAVTPPCDAGNVWADVHTGITVYGTPDGIEFVDAARNRRADIVPWSPDPFPAFVRFVNAR